MYGCNCCASLLSVLKCFIILLWWKETAFLGMVVCNVGLWFTVQWKIFQKTTEMLLHDKLDLHFTYCIPLHSSVSLAAVCCFVFAFDTLLFRCILLCVIFCWGLNLHVCVCVCERVSLSACGEPGGGTHLGGCSSTPRHAPSAPSGCGRTKPVHFHSHAPAGRILIIISPMMRRCDALHSRSLSQFLSFFSLSLFLLFTFVVSEEKRKEKNKGDFNLTPLFAKISAIFLLQSQIKVFLWYLLQLRVNYTVVLCDNVEWIYCWYFKISYMVVTNV